MDLGKLQKQDYQTGQVLLIDKPLGWTSFQVVNKVRWLIRQGFDIKKIKVGIFHFIMLILAYTKL